MANRKKEIEAIAQRYGFFLHRQGKHLIFRRPGSRGQVVTGITLSCHRALANIEHRFRRAALFP